ncbi:MAG: ferredoxin [Microcoleaceae cyanobacterium]
MSKPEKQVTEFNLSGQVVLVFFKGCQPKYLQLMTENGIHLIKLSKECRAVAERLLIPGQQVQVSGWRKVDLKKGKIKLKAEFVSLLSTEQGASTQRPTADVDQIAESSRVPESPASEDSISEALNPETVAKSSTGCPKKAKILVCQKSDCRKRGANQLYAALEEELAERQLQGQVKLQSTGCLKRCKAGPNVIFMPDKANFSRVKLATVPALVERHLADK